MHRTRDWLDPYSPFDADGLQVTWLPRSHDETRSFENLKVAAEKLSHQGFDITKLIVQECWNVWMDERFRIADEADDADAVAYRAPTRSEDEWTDVLQESLDSFQTFDHQDGNE